MVSGMVKKIAAGPFFHQFILQLDKLGALNAGEVGIFERFLLPSPFPLPLPHSSVNLSSISHSSSFAFNFSPSSSLLSTSQQAWGWLSGSWGRRNQLLSHTLFLRCAYKGFPEALVTGKVSFSLNIHPTHFTNWKFIKACKMSECTFF